MLYVANWKTYMSSNEEYSWLMRHQAELKELAAVPSKEIVICPSLVSLVYMKEFFTATSVKWGSQTCSPYPLGAHTGEVPAQSLSNVLCQYAILGHSERRQPGWCTPESLANAAKQLHNFNIIPILCIGETQHERDAGITHEVLELQLKSVLDLMSMAWMFPMYIAYEPIWAIGTGITPNIEEMDQTIKHIFMYIKNNYLAVHLRVLYGGSVTSENVAQFKQINELGGFLIGSASTRFQEFKNIVSL